MRIRQATDADWRAFLHFAAQEGWQVPQLEIELFSGPMARGAFALTREERCLGFITAAAYPRSGWIGNLILPPDERGKGYGALLFDHAVRRLEEDGVQSLLLTASALGKPLYERRGFSTIGTIERWRFDPGAQSHHANPEDPMPFACLQDADVLAWQEERLGLLPFIRSRGQAFSLGRSCLHLQWGKDLQVLGPWYTGSRCNVENRQLILKAMAAAAPGVPLFTDILTRSGLAPVLKLAGFRRTGSTDLMLKGPRPPLLTSTLVSLASLGSIG